MQWSPGNDPRQWSRRSWIAFLGGLGLLAAGLIATGTFPVLSTVVAIVGIAAMIYGVCGGRNGRSQPGGRWTAGLSGSALGGKASVRCQDKAQVLRVRGVASCARSSVALPAPESSPMRAGIHPKVVQEWLGHSTISITLDTYSDVVAGLHEQAAEEVAALFRTPVSNPSAEGR